MLQITIFDVNFRLFLFCEDQSSMCSHVVSLYVLMQDAGVQVVQHVQEFGFNALSHWAVCDMEACYFGIF